MLSAMLSALLLIAASADVKKLSSKFFPSATSKHSWLVHYHSDTETQRRAVAEVARVAKLLDKSSVKVGAIDCNAAKTKQLCAGAGATLPAVKLFVSSTNLNGGERARNYSGSIDAAKMLEFCRRELGREALLAIPPKKAKADKKKSPKAAKKTKATKPKPGKGTLTKYTPVDVKVGVGNEGQHANMQVFVPNKGETQIADPKTLFQHVKGAFDTVVESNQAGLMDVKHKGGPVAALSPQEAWHHFQAGKDGVIDSARFLIAFSVVPSVQSGGTPLHIAASMGQLEKVEELLDDGHDVDAEKADGNTPLHSAAAMGHENVVAVLLDSEARIDATGQSGATPLMMASAMGHTEVVRLLLKRKAEIDYAHRFAGTTALHFAAEMGRTDVIEVLCEAGADVEAPKSTGGTALHTAADTNQSAAVRVLLQPPCRADLTKKMMGDTEPLYLAAQRGFPEVCRELLLAGANADFAMPRGAYKGHVTVRGQSDAGSASYYGLKNTEVGNGATALHAAVENGRFECVKVLLEFGAEQSTSMEGASPYHHPHIALALLRQKQDLPYDKEFGEEGGKKAKVNVKAPQDGSTPLFVAAGEGYDAVVDALVKSGAQVDIANKHGATPLSHAVVRGRAKTVQRLLRAGADPNAQVPGDTPGKSKGKSNSKGEVYTCLHTALVSTSMTKSTRRKIVSMLAKRGGTLGEDIGMGLMMVLATSAAGEDLGLVETLLDGRDDGVDVDEQAADGRTALVLAAERGRVALLKWLLDKGANAELRVARTGASAIMLAAMRGQEESVRVLAEAGADVNAQGDSTIMYEASALYLAVQSRSVDSARHLLQHGAQIDPILRQVGVTPLFMAAERGDADMVQLLLSHRANLTARNWNGMTPLAMASIRGNIDVMRVLMKAEQKQKQENAAVQSAAAAGAKAEGEERVFGFSLLPHAHSHERIPLLLCACGGCDKEESQAGQPPPPHPSNRRDRPRFMPVVKLLLGHVRRAEDVEVEGGWASGTGKTPLLAAVELGWTEVVKLLLEKLKALAKDFVKGAAASISKQQRQVEEERWLARHLDAWRSEGGTALHLASERGYVGCVRLLLEGGANYTLADAAGETAMDKARSRRDFDLINLLGRYDVSSDVKWEENSTATYQEAACTAPGQCDSVADEIIDLDAEQEEQSSTERFSESNAPHRVLGVAKEASPQEITSAYRKLSRIYHPDKTADATAEIFTIISEAHKKLLREAKMRAAARSFSEN